MKQRYSDLLKRILELDYHYYTLDNPLVSDKKYDELYSELLMIEKDNPGWVDENSPSLRIGGDTLKKFEKKQHTEQLYSLDKGKGKDRIKKYFKDTDVDEYVLEWKFDGLPIVTRYEDGLLVEARTRGDGVIGEVVTEQAKTIRSVPLTISYKKAIEIQGEVILPKDKLEAYNNMILNKIMSELASGKQSEETIRNKYTLYKNARNGASGALRQLNPKETAKRSLDFIAYDVNYIEGKKLNTQLEIFSLLKDNGFKLSSLAVACKQFSDIDKKLDELEIERSKLNFEVDGLVLKVNKLKERNRLGYTSKYPKWAIAYKFEALEETTKIEKITWEVGRTGRITPIGWVTPVDIGGYTVSKATLNNLDHIKALGIYSDSEVYLRRSGDVIPQITGVVSDKEGVPVDIPEECPSCGSKLKVEQPFLFCINKKKCPAQKIRKWMHFSSLGAMNIEGFSGKTALQLLQNNLITEFPDLYDLKKEDLLELESFKEKKAGNLLSAIEKSKNVSWPNFIYALGMPNTGKGTSQRLAKNFPDWKTLKIAGIDELVEVEDIGEKSAELINSFLSDEENTKMIEMLFEKGVKPLQETPDILGDIFKDKIVAITGTLNEPKKHFEKIITEQGGKVSSSVSKKTDFLLAGEKAGSKLEKARNYGTKILSEDEFKAML